MLRSEKKSLFRFLIIYIVTTMILFLSIASLFYIYEKHRLLDLQINALKQDSETLTVKLRELHNDTTNKLSYPSNNSYKSAIFDIDKNYIFGDFEPKDIDFNLSYLTKGEFISYIKSVSPHYLGTAHLVLQKPINQKPIKHLKEMIILFLALALVIFLTLGYFLGRLFTAPMRESFETMNRFIQDTTHELNTPISTILTNIELLDTLYECEGKKERKRIEIASKTLSRLYDDLTYLKLNHQHHRDIKPCNISNLLEERVLYFDSMIEAKKIKLQKQIQSDIIKEIDENDAIRLIDNLLSNAIKYNRQKGLLKIILDEKQISIEDSGIGMKQSDIDMIFKRFQRANKSEGGFGIGMDIVNQIISFYGFQIEIKSQEKKGTKVNIKW